MKIPPTFAAVAVFLVGSSTVLESADATKLKNFRDLFKFPDGKSAFSVASKPSVADDEPSFVGKSSAAHKLRNNPAYTPAEKYTLKWLSGGSMLLVTPQGEQYETENTRSKSGDVFTMSFSRALGKVLFKGTYEPTRHAMGLVRSSGIDYESLHVAISPKSPKVKVNLIAECSATECVDTTTRHPLVRFQRRQMSLRDSTIEVFPAGLADKERYLAAMLTLFQIKKNYHPIEKDENSDAEVFLTAQAFQTKRGPTGTIGRTLIDRDRRQERQKASDAARMDAAELLEICSDLADNYGMTPYRTPIDMIRNTTAREMYKAAKCDCLNLMTGYDAEPTTPFADVPAYFNAPMKRQFDADKCDCVFYNHLIEMQALSNYLPFINQKVKVLPKSASSLKGDEYQYSEESGSEYVPNWTAEELADHLSMPPGTVQPTWERYSDQCFNNYGDNVFDPARHVKPSFSEWVKDVLF